MTRTRIHRTGMLVAALAVCAALAAQPRLRHHEIYFGVQGGVLGSGVYFKPTVPNLTPFVKTAFLGGNGGFVFRYSEQKCCAVQVELNYMLRGWRENNEGGYYTRSLHYVEVPFLMHIYFGSERFRGFFNLGPEIGYCVYDDKGRGVQQESGHQYAALDKPFDWGVAGGLGCYYRSRKAGIYQLEARFNYSLGTIFANDATDYFSSSNAMSLSLNFAWLWEFKKK